jgi:hypothetical protein
MEFQLILVSGEEGGGGGEKKKKTAFSRPTPA